MRTAQRLLIPTFVITLATASYAGVKSDKSEPPKRFATFEMTRPAQTSQAIAARATAAAEAITGQKMSKQAAVPAMATTTTQAAARMNITLPDAPQLEVAYLPEYDELRIVDTELAASTAPGRDIERDEAVAIAKRAFVELGRRKVVNAEEYNWDGADVASTWVGGGSSDGKVSESRKRVEYRVTARRQINGIEVANAGIRIAVHASGRVSGVRVGGLRVASKRGAAGEEPTGKGTWRDRKVEIGELDARFEREVVAQKGRAKVAWARVMYVMPENQRSAVVEPLYVVSYSLHVPTDDGQIAISRRKTVGFSLTEPKAQPVDLTPPARVHEVDKEKKPVPASQ